MMQFTMILIKSFATETRSLNYIPCFRGNYIYIKRKFEIHTKFMRPLVTIEYCPKCNWLLRAAYMAQEFLTTFEEDLQGVTLMPSVVNGRYTIHINEQKVFDRKEYGGFPEIKELKQLVRDVVAPGKSLGHSDTKAHHQQ
jgi:selenoprotein W-related protein